MQWTMVKEINEMNYGLKEINAIEFFFNWDSPYPSLNSHYETWSYKKRSTKKIAGYRKSLERTYS